MAAHPALVLGAIVVSVSTATFGVMQTPVWIGQAHDNAAEQVLNTIEYAENVALSKSRGYMDGGMLYANAANLAVYIDPTDIACVTAHPTGAGYAAVAKSKSGNFAALVKAPGVPVTKRGAGKSVEEAVNAAGGLPAGIAVPVGADGKCVAGADVTA